MWERRRKGGEMWESKENWCMRGCVFFLGGGDGDEGGGKEKRDVDLIEKGRVDLRTRDGDEGMR